VHAYGRYGASFGPISFHLHWLRAADDGTALAFDAYAPAAALARADRFVPPTPGTPFADHEYGLTLNLPRYLAMMRAFARHVGVREEAGTIGGVELDARGWIAAVMTEDRRRLAAELFVDATGPAARLRSALDGRRNDWCRWLPCDRVLLAEAAAPVEPLVLTRVTALPGGWHWTSGRQSGIAYASDYLTDSRAARVLRNAAGAEPDGPIRLDPGTRPEPWRGNVVAIGDAATQVEPLEWCNLHLALSAIDRLVAMLPGRTPAPVEAADFNRQTLAEAERVRDFLAMHWHVAKRGDPLWRQVAAAEPPASLAHTLAQFAERGRLPFYEEETFARDSWLAVLLGRGVRPRRLDPLVETVPANQASTAMAALIARCAGAMLHMPTHAAYRAAQLSRLSL
jgi:tryptophan halogenase